MLELKVPPPVIALLCVLGMYFLDRVFPSFGGGASTAWLIAVVLVTLASLIAIMALVQFKRARTTIHPNVPHNTRQIVTSGVYSMTRNPMYLALVMMIFAAGIAMQNSAVFLFVPASVWYLNRYQIVPEERILESKFGDQYRAYKAKTRRWI